MIDFENEEVKKGLAEMANKTGMSIEEVISMYNFYDENITYVRFIKGENKGKVGYYYPSNELMPYSREVYCKDCVVVTMGWGNSFEVISEEEYLKEIDNESV